MSAEETAEYEDEAEVGNDVRPPLHDATIVDEIVARIEESGQHWKRPSEPLSVDGRSWLPYLVSDRAAAVLHVHISAIMPRYVVTRLRAAAASYRVYVALTIEALYDEEVLEILREVDAEVVVVGEDSIPKSAYYLAALADNSVPVELELRRKLALDCWSRRRAGSNFDKGRHFEGLLAFMLSSVNGFRIFARNFNGETDEIDIVVRVDSISDACWSEPGVPFVVVEAKNRIETVGSAVVALLIRKLETRRGRARIGLLFSTSSFSSEAADEELKEAKGNLCVVMLGPKEIEGWIEAGDPTSYLDGYVARAMLR
jgi:Holliday junction resolvase-like predicted endonuclease